MVLMRNNMKRFITLVCIAISKFQKMYWISMITFKLGFGFVESATWLLIFNIESWYAHWKDVGWNQNIQQLENGFKPTQLFSEDAFVIWDFKLTCYVWSLKGNYIKGIRSESCCLFLTMANQIEIIYQEKHTCISYGQPNLVTKCWGGHSI